MTDQIRSDIPQSPISVGAPAGVMAQYASFFAKYSQSILDYAQAYTSNRLQLAQRTLQASAVSDPMNTAIRIAQAALLRRVLYEAQFTPAHPARISPKMQESISYFVLHRPGKNPKACTFTNTMATFLIPPSLDGNKDSATHFIIGPQGQLVQMIDLDDGAHHVGRGNMNFNSVGVEITGAISEPIPAAQFERVVWLLATMSAIGQFPIDTAHVLKHSTLAPRIREDPGPHLNYLRLLAEANRAKARLGAAVRTLYKSPFDPATDVYKDIAAILDAANTSRGPGQKALRISSAARIESIFRSDQMVRATRTSIATAAQTHAEHIATNQQADVANRTFTDRQAQAAEEEISSRREAAAASTAVVGYNLETGLWSDGSQI